MYLDRLTSSSSSCDVPLPSHLWVRLRSFMLLFLETVPSETVWMDTFGITLRNQSYFLCRIRLESLEAIERQCELINMFVVLPKIVLSH